MTVAFAAVDAAPPAAAAACRCRHPPGQPVYPRPEQWEAVPQRPYQVEDIPCPSAPPSRPYPFRGFQTPAAGSPAPRRSRRSRWGGGADSRRRERSRTGPPRPLPRYGERKGYNCKRRARSPPGGESGQCSCVYRILTAFPCPGRRAQTLVISISSISAMVLSMARQRTTAAAVSTEVKTGIARSTAIRRIWTLASFGSRPWASVERI